MIKNFLPILVLTILSVNIKCNPFLDVISQQTTHSNDSKKFTGSQNPETCDNHYIFLSTFNLGRQQDLINTFVDINKNVKIPEVVYRDQLFRTYRIFNMSQTISYQDGKQAATLIAMNVLRITGGSVKITYNFTWEKQQLGTSLFGTGSGAGTTDIITYEKLLQTNSTHQLQWQLFDSSPLQITSGLRLEIMSPYREADYKILSDMLNQLKNNETTVKQSLLNSINAQYQTILAVKVKQDKTLQFDKVIEYTYSDYRDYHMITYNNTLINSSLTKEGLNLIFSQKIIGDDDFQCGEKVPFQPTQNYGGLQEYFSNSLIKSTLIYAIKNGSLDVILNEQFWQSRAFQFFMGDVHEVIPGTKNLSTQVEINGKCKAQIDSIFSLVAKGKNYEISVNFTCELLFNKQRLVNIALPVNYMVEPQLASKTLKFKIVSIQGVPGFTQFSGLKIQNLQLAKFMVGQTLMLAKNEEVFGTGYKVMARKMPNIQLKEKYMLLYDASQVKISRDFILNQ